MTKIRKITKQGKNKNSLEKKGARAPHKYNKYNNNKKAENNKNNKSAQKKNKKKKQTNSLEKEGAAAPAALSACSLPFTPRKGWDELLYKVEVIIGKKRGFKECENV